MPQSQFNVIFKVSILWKNLETRVKNIKIFVLKILYFLLEILDKHIWKIRKEFVYKIWINIFIIIKDEEEHIKIYKFFYCI